MIYFDRLLRLADFLWLLPAERFNFSQWAQINWSGQPLTETCGTTACALGWATAIPEFKELGLRLVRLSPLSSKRLGSIAVAASQVKTDSWTTSALAANEIFGLSEDETTYLFVPSDNTYGCYEELGDQFGNDGKPAYWASPQTVAQHIRTFVAENNQ